MVNKMEQVDTKKTGQFLPGQQSSSFVSPDIGISVTNTSLVLV